MSIALAGRLNFTGSSTLPVVLQSEATECGLACLAMVASYHRRRIDLNTLRREHSISLKGSKLKDLMEIAGQLGFATRALRLEIDELQGLRLPAILHWNLTHFVVLQEVHRGMAVIVDPAVGRRRLSLSVVSKSFTGVALELVPANGFTPADERVRLKLRQLWKEAVGIKRFLAQVIAVSVLLQGLALLSPFYIQLVVDEAVVRLDETFLSLLALGFVVVTLLQAALAWLRSWAVVYMSNLLTLQMQGNLLRHLLRLPLNYFHKRHIGDVVSRFGSMSAIQHVLTTGLIEAVVDGLMVIFTLAVLILYQPALTAIVVGVLLLYVLARAFWYQILREVSAESVVLAANAETQFIETVRGMSTVKLLGIESERLNQWQNRQVDVTNVNIRIARLNLAFSTANKLLFGLGYVAIVYLGANMVFEQAFTVGMLMAFAAYQTQFLGAASALVDQFIIYKLLDVHLARVSDVALSTPEEAKTQAPATAPSGNLALHGVSFRYAQAEPFLLTNISFDAREGGCIAIVGPSGCGKSTLLRIALGLEKPVGGVVTIGGVEISKIGLTNYRRMVGAVTQDDKLLSGSIAENLTSFDHHPNLARMVQCAKLCCIHEAIMGMPMNYHSLIGDMGDVLSAGERQRLMLARALYRKPKILFLDEATSNLDGELDEQINSMLADLKITRVIVTHRQTPLGYADRIYRLLHGKLEAVSERPHGVRAAGADVGPRPAT